MKMFILILAIPPMLLNIGTPEMRRKIVDLLPFKMVQEPKSLIDTMDNEARDLVNKRKATLSEKGGAALDNNGLGKDILSILCGLSF